MGNTIVAAAKPLIDYLLGFRYRLESGENMDSHTVRGDIIYRLGEMESSLRTNPSLHSKIEPIKYIMTGFADEVVLSSNWDRAKEWHDRLLEMELFKTSVVGERFFTLLEDEGYRDPDMAELFYTCIVLGFRGRYRNQQEKINTVKQRLYALLPNRLPDDERRLTPGAENVMGGKQKNLPKMFGLSALVIVLIVSLFLYLVASQWMWSDIAEVINDVRKSLLSR